jgi:hypothetical protein
MKIFTTCISIILFSMNAASQKPVVPAEAKPFIPNGFEVMEIVSEDLNLDRLRDYIIVYRSKAEDSTDPGGDDWETPRPMSILLRQAGNKLKVAATNNKLVLCKYCGGVFGDPYEGITSRPGQFTISFYGGSNWRWSHEYTFKYEQAAKDWFLEKHKSSSFNSTDPEKTMSETIIPKKEIGNISLAGFDPEYNTDSSTWKVKVLKTYFYNSPDLLSKPRKAYLVKGNTVQSIKQFTNFIECIFTNEKLDMTYGYLLKKDLEIVKQNGPQKNP